MGAISAPATATTILGAYNVKNYGAKGDIRDASDTGTTNGSAVVTSATIAFTQADKDKRIYIASGLGGQLRFNGTILSVQSATQCTVSANVGATLSNQYMRVGTDDTAAIQAAINASANGAPVYFPAGRYKITSQVTLKKMSHLIGVATGYPSDVFGTEIDALTFNSICAFAPPANARNVVIEGFYFQGPTTSVSTGSSAIGADQTYNTIIRNVYVAGFYRGIDLNNSQNILIEGVWVSGSQQNGLKLTNCSAFTVVGCLFANAANSSTDAANILVETNSGPGAFYLGLQDEGPPATLGGTVYFKSCTDVLFSCPRLYLSTTGNGILIGAAATRVTILGTAVIPFAGNRVPAQTIKILAGAVNTRLIGVTTDPNGGGDVSDAGTGTEYIGCVFNGVAQTQGLPSGVTAIAADTTLTAADSGKVLRVTGVDKVVTLPATVAGLRYTFVVAAAALSAGTGFQIAPNAVDKIMGNGLTSADNKALINSGATDAEGDTVTLVGDGVDGYYVEAMRGTWARQA